MSSLIYFNRYLILFTNTRVSLIFFFVFFKVCVFLWSFIFKFRFYFKEGSVGDVIMGVECRKKSEKKEKKRRKDRKKKMFNYSYIFGLPLIKTMGFLS